MCVVAPRLFPPSLLGEGVRGRGPLLDVGLRASLFEFGLRGGRLVLRDALLDGLRGSLDHVLRLFFPEGGRTATGHPEEFLNGPAFMAIRAGVPIVPMALIGTHELLPIHTLRDKFQSVQR